MNASDMGMFSSILITTGNMAKSQAVALTELPVHIDRVDSESRRVNQPEKNQIVLVPPPSDNPKDPLNWKLEKKIFFLVILSFSTFATFSASLGGILMIGPMARVYHVSQRELAYQSSAVNGGRIIGSLLFYYWSKICGRMSAIFWSLVGVALTQLWSVSMTRRDDLLSFLISRGFSGFFSVVVGVLTPRCLIDIFFLHQRGRAITFFQFWFDIGIVAGPSICTFIATGAHDWRWAFWWPFILTVVSLAMVFFFIEDTSWDRTSDSINRRIPDSFLANRVATFLPGSKITRKLSHAELVDVLTLPFKILLTPVTLVLISFIIINFGFIVGLNTVTPVWLQRPAADGGYGFTPLQNAYFQFAQWIATFFFLLYGHFVSDRVPLAISARFGKGSWKPEYRLHTLWFPALIVTPLGLGVVGIALGRHLSWVVFAVGHVMVTFGAFCTSSVAINYLAECFTGHAEEAAIILSFGRLALGLSIIFFVQEWATKVGFAWAYGMMAIIVACSYGSVMLLMWKGHTIRKWDVFGLVETEEGVKVIESE